MSVPTPPPGDGLVGREVRKQFVNEAGETEWFGGVIVSYDRSTRCGAAAAQQARGFAVRNCRAALVPCPRPTLAARAACAASASGCGADTRIGRVRRRWYKIQYEDGDTEECTREDTVACLVHSSSWTPASLQVRGARARAAAGRAGAPAPPETPWRQNLTRHGPRSLRSRQRGRLRPRRASRPAWHPRRR